MDWEQSAETGENDLVASYVGLPGSLLFALWAVSLGWARFWVSRRDHALILCPALIDTCGSSLYDLVISSRPIRLRITIGYRSQFQLPPQDTLRVPDRARVIRSSHLPTAQH